MTTKIRKVWFSSDQLVVGRLGNSLDPTNSKVKYKNGFKQVGLCMDVLLNSSAGI